MPARTRRIASGFAIPFGSEHRPLGFQTTLDRFRPDVLAVDEEKKPPKLEKYSSRCRLTPEPVAMLEVGGVGRRPASGLELELRDSDHPTAFAVYE
jgi:hypothetical protein